MMTQNTYTSQSRKNKIELHDYDSIKDLQNRILLTQLSVFEVEVLREIIFNSLEFPISELVESLEVSSEKILQALEILEPTKLFTRRHETIVVDKDARKYYEIQIQKFGSEAKLDVDHFLTLLSQVPIHVLPNWYSLSKTSDDIFEAILEKNLLTPKIYEKYLAELQFNDEYSALIVKDLFSTENFVLEVEAILEKYALSREELEELIIVLEFNTVCFLQYIEEGEHWKGVLTPLEEWKNHLDFLKETTCTPIAPETQIERVHARDFGFIEDVDLFLREIEEAASPLKIKTEGQSYQLLSPIGTSSFSAPYLSHLIDKMLQLRLVTIDQQELQATEHAKQWLTTSLQEKAMVVYFSTINRFRKQQHNEVFTDRDVRELEKSLKRVLNTGWIYTEDFIKGLTASQSTTCEVTLTKKGRRYSYSRPIYGEKELAFIHDILRGHLFESGMLALGSHQGKECFIITPFGRLSLGE